MLALAQGLSDRGVVPPLRSAAHGSGVVHHDNTPENASRVHETRFGRHAGMTVGPHTLA
jgi:hypothetical protein